MTSDWREVYLQEKRHPGYVIENGRLPHERDRKPWNKQPAIILSQPKKKAA